MGATTAGMLSQAWAQRRISPDSAEPRSAQLPSRWPTLPRWGPRHQHLHQQLSRQHYLSQQQREQSLPTPRLGGDKCLGELCKLLACRAASPGHLLGRDQADSSFCYAARLFSNCLFAFKMDLPGGRVSPMVPGSDGKDKCLLLGSRPAVVQPCLTWSTCTNTAKEGASRGKHTHRSPQASVSSLLRMQI